MTPIVFSRAPLDNGAWELLLNSLQARGIDAKHQQIDLHDNEILLDGVPIFRQRAGRGKLLLEPKPAMRATNQVVVEVAAELGLLKIDSVNREGQLFLFIIALSLFLLLKWSPDLLGQSRLASVLVPVPLALLSLFTVADGIASIKKNETFPRLHRRPLFLLTCATWLGYAAYIVAISVIDGWSLELLLVTALFLAGVSLLLPMSIWWGLHRIYRNIWLRDLQGLAYFQQKPG